MHLQDKREVFIRQILPLIKSNSRKISIQHTVTPSTYGGESDITPHDETNGTIDFKEPSHICISEENVNVTKSIVNDMCKIISGNEGNDPLNFLKTLKLTNVNRIIIGQLNINSLRNKYGPLHALIRGNVDILVITETKLDESFPNSQFALEGYQTPLRLDRNSEGGGIMICQSGHSLQKIK